MPITTAADDIHKYLFIGFSEKIRLDVSSESSAGQRIHMKSQALFLGKVKTKKLKCHLLQFLFGALRLTEKMLLAYLDVVGSHVGRNQLPKSFKFNCFLQSSDK